MTLRRSYCHDVQKLSYTFRVDSADLERWKGEAKEARLPLSEWIRLRLNGERPGIAYENPKGEVKRIIQERIDKIVKEGDAPREHMTDSVAAHNVRARSTPATTERRVSKTSGERPCPAFGCNGAMKQQANGHWMCDRCYHKRSADWDGLP